MRGPNFSTWDGRAGGEALVEGRSELSSFIVRRGEKWSGEGMKRDRQVTTPAVNCF